MRIVVFGATGRIGRRLVAGGVARGHQVTAATRHPERVRVVGGAPRVVVCDVMDASQVAAAAAHQDAVVVAVGARHAFAPGRLHTQGTENVIAGMRRHAVHRLICLSAAGTHDEADPNLPPFFTRVVRPLLLGRVWRELIEMEALVGGTELEWTIVHAPRLTNGPALASYRVAEGRSLRGGHAISRADVADFILKELARAQWVRRHVALAY